MAHYHEQHGHHLRDYAFGFMDRWARLASAIPGVTTRLANLPLQIPGVSPLIKQSLGIAPQRTLPTIRSTQLPKPAISKRIRARAGITVA